MAKQSAKERVAELRLMRNYAIDVIACGVAAGMPGITKENIEARKKSLDAQEEQIMAILDKPNGY